VSSSCTPAGKKKNESKKENGLPAYASNRVWAGWFKPSPYAIGLDPAPKKENKNI